MPGGGTLTDTDFIKSERTLTAVYFPTPVYVTYDEGQFNITCGSEKPFYGLYLFQEDNAFEVEGTTVTATISLEKPADFVQIHIPCDPTEVGGTFGCSLIRPVACKSVGIVDGKIVENELRAGARLNGISDADGLLFAGRLTSPGTAADYTFTFVTDEAIYTLIRDSKTLEGGKQYNFPALTGTGPDDWNKTDAEDLCVDLGLTVKWAKCNLGASTPIQKGDYFAWGEILPKSDYYWSNYLYGSGDDAITKYCNDASCGKDGFTDDLVVLLPEDDAAYAALGGKFRMPTKAEMDELWGKITPTWTTQDGVSGYLFTYNDNSIFLPLAGYRDSETPGSGMDTTGDYWTSSLSTDVPFAGWKLFFDSDNIFTKGEFRFIGQPIRPVCDR